MHAQHDIHSIREGDASACIQRHQASALAPVHSTLYTGYDE